MYRYRKRIVLQILKYVIGCGLIFFILKLTLHRIGEEDKLIPTLDELDKLLVEAENDNFQRLLTVKYTCRRYNLGAYKEPDKLASFKHPPAPQYSVFYISRSHNLSYCPIYKAGSTTWIYNLCLLMNVAEEELNSGKEQISTIARRVIPELEYPAADEALEATKKLLVVRHPFERLLSAYRDKLENSVAGREHGTLHFYRKYGSKIVQKYRGESRQNIDRDIPCWSTGLTLCTRMSPMTRHHTSGETLLMIIQSYASANRICSFSERNYTEPTKDQVIRLEGIPSPAGIEPTFKEFVQYLINTDLASYGDDHWMPYYFFCTPCIVDYDIIAKVETLWRDQIYTIHKLGLQKVIKPRWRHSGGHSSASRIYFSQLNKDMVQKLYGKFKLDFDLFDYSPDDYYQYATPV